MIEAQRKDDVLEQVIEAVTHGIWPSSKDMSSEMMLQMRDGLLCRVGKKSIDETLQLVLPGEFLGKVLCALQC